MPEHWEAIRLRFKASVNPSRSELYGFDDKSEVSFVPMEAVGEYGGISNDATRPLAEVTTGYTHFRNGDVLTAKITPCFENGKGAIARGLVNGLGFGTTELHVLRPREEIDTHFLFYVTISHAFRSLGAACMYGAGGQKRVPDEFVRDFKNPIPPLPEQRAIAAFLDRETARIDGLIAKKQRQIELLQEKRAALISHAVTKGLDPDAPMKDSGIEWLGQIPEHWEVRKVKHLTTKIGSGKTPKGGAEIYVHSGVMFFRSQNVHFDGLRLDDVVFIEDDVDAEMPNTRVQPSDVLLNITGASLGRCCLVGEDLGRANVNQHVCIIRAHRSKILPDYLCAAISSVVAQSQIFASENGTSREGLSFQQVGSLLIVVPPRIEEQVVINRHIRIRMEQTHVLIRKAIESTDLLREYRTALISAAVTGKIDVREEGNLAPSRKAAKETTS